MILEALRALSHPHPRHLEALLDVGKLDGAADVRAGGRGVERGPLGVAAPRLRVRGLRIVARGVALPLTFLPSHAGAGRKSLLATPFCSLKVTEFSKFGSKTENLENKIFGSFFKFLVTTHTRGVADSLVWLCGPGTTWSGQD